MCVCVCVCVCVYVCVEHPTLHDWTKGNFVVGLTHESRFMHVSLEKNISSCLHSLFWGHVFTFMYLYVFLLTYIFALTIYAFRFPMRFEAYSSSHYKK